MKSTTHVIVNMDATYKKWKYRVRLSDGRTVTLKCDEGLTISQSRAIAKVLWPRVEVLNWTSI